MRRMVFMLAATAGMLMAPLALSPASAGHCNPNPASIVIFSSPVGVNTNALVCVAAPGETDAAGLDTRNINPGSTGVSVRYLVGCALGDSLTVTVEGLGASGTFDAPCVATTTGAVVFQTATIPIDPLALGDITATIDPLRCEEDGDPESSDCSITFHTVEGTI